MAQPGDIDQRVTTLEKSVHELAERLPTTEELARRGRETTAAARVLAGGADHGVRAIGDDIRELRQATTGPLNAMRADLTDFRTAVTARFGAVARRFDAVDRGFTEIRGRLAAAAGQQQAVDLLTRMIDQQTD